MASPPALLEGAGGARHGRRIEDLKVYYFEATKAWLSRDDPSLRADGSHPPPLHVPECDRAGADQARRGGRRTQGRRVRAQQLPSGASPADRGGRHRHVRLHRLRRWTRTAISASAPATTISTTVARAAKRLIVEVNRNMPRVQRHRGRTAPLGGRRHRREPRAVARAAGGGLRARRRGDRPHHRRPGAATAACLQMGVGALLQPGLRPA